VSRLEQIGLGLTRRIVAALGERGDAVSDRVYIVPSLRAERSNPGVVGRRAALDCFVTAFLAMTMTIRSDVVVLRGRTSS
jgi:hypothetical protein